MRPLETELAEARMLLKIITGGTFRLSRYGKDLTERERVLLERDFAVMERTLGHATDPRGRDGGVREKLAAGVKEKPRACRGFKVTR